MQRFTEHRHSHSLELSVILSIAKAAVGQILRCAKPNFLFSSACDHRPPHPVRNSREELLARLAFPAALPRCTAFLMRQLTCARPLADWHAQLEWSWSDWIGGRSESKQMPVSADAVHFKGREHWARCGGTLRTLALS